MIKSLRKRFVITAMLSLVILLTILFGGIWILGFTAVNKQVDSYISSIEAANGLNSASSPLFPSGFEVFTDSSSNLSYFIAYADSEGKLLAVRSSIYYLAENTDIPSLTAQALANSEGTGKIGSYKYKTDIVGNVYCVIFVDCSVQYQTLRDTMLVSLIVGTVCLLLMFVIVLLLSGRAIKPIAANMEKQRRFVTDAGHEIKTPLAIIMANAEALELTAGETKWTGNIKSQVIRLDGLMKNLLMLSRSDEKTAKPVFTQLDYSLLINDVTESFTELAQQKEIVFSSAVPPGIMINGSRESLIQLISLLADNAVKYSDNNNTIYISLSSHGKKSVFEIKNTCSSLPSSPPEALFDRFYRGDEARTQKSGGYGIGLSVARAITEVHGGKIEAFYDSENTIRFRVEI